MNKIVFGLFLLAAAGQDIRKKQVDMWIYLVFGCAAAGLLVFHMLGGGIWLDGMRGISETELTTEAGSGWQYLTDALTGGTLGLGLLGIGMVSSGSVGSGDGLFFFISGLLLGSKRFKALINSCGILPLTATVYARLSVVSQSAYTLSKISFFCL